MNVSDLAGNATFSVTILYRKSTRLRVWYGLILKILKRLSTQRLVQFVFERNCLLTCTYHLR
jgi:hypothetical protein